MNPEQQRKLQEYSIAIAEILYTEAESEQQFTLEIIEKTIQTQLASVCQSRNCRFFFKQSTGTTAGRTRKLTSTLGILKISEKQAKILGVKPCTRISAHLEQCCLRLSANMSYEQTAVDERIHHRCQNQCHVTAKISSSARVSVADSHRTN